jgi:protein-S-isoprenylcysteine O-methyltransferase Ste14
MLQQKRVPLDFAFAGVFLFFRDFYNSVDCHWFSDSRNRACHTSMASGHFRKNQFLANSGPYSYTRNPLYLGSFMPGLGLTVG